MRTPLTFASYPSSLNVNFFFKFLSWQLLDVFQRREILKPKKEINASKLPAGSPERCLIQEAGAEGAL